MIYLDNAATTWPKPDVAVRALCECMGIYGANAGRSGHKMAIDTAQVIYDVREQISDFFGLGKSENVVFTLNATMALNIIIKGILRKGDHAIATVMDHNSVLRALYSLAPDVQISLAPADKDGYVSTQSVNDLIKPNTRLVVMTHVSNVCGTVMPVFEVARLCREKGIYFLLDASQSAGILDINMQRDCIDFAAMPGHKALYGPMGTGVLLINRDADIAPLIFGGTGSSSASLLQPGELPDRFESGTLNVPGIYSLGKAVSFVDKIGVENICKHEMKLTEMLIKGLLDIKDIKIIGKTECDMRTGVVSFVHEKKDSVEVAEQLDSLSDIATRAMYHCAYRAHEALGTSEGGTVRASVGFFNTENDIAHLLDALDSM